MEEQIETCVSPQQVWNAWERAQLTHEKKGTSEFPYEIIDLKKGESFSLLWKTRFVRLIFSHTVKPIQQGSQISYKVQIKGLFAWPVRWLLGNKIRKNISLVLKSIVKDLENQRVK